MNLRPPPPTDDKEMDSWLNELYEFLKFPVFPGNSVSPHLNYGEDAEANDTYVVTIDGITELTSGLLITFKANTVNTGACTLNVNSLGAKALKVQGDGADPPNGWITADNIVVAIYDGTVFQIINPDMTL